MKPKIYALQPYIDAAITLMPLHRWDRTSVHKGKERQDGKRPFDSNWTKKAYKTSETIERSKKTGCNVGVRLEATWVVIDVDPRHFEEGDDPLARLLKETGIDRDLCPEVRTGSGGTHLYLRKPKDVVLLDSIPGYQGVEFKSKGRQVVAAGSVHPDKVHYTWVDKEDALTGEPITLAEAPEAPEALLNLARRAQRKDGMTRTGGVIDPLECAKMLDALDPEDFRDEHEWRTLMMAVHHATNGDARSEFIEWSTRDPEYTDDGWMIGRRWDSLHRERPGETIVTYTTFYHYLRQAGKGNLIPDAVVDPNDDFDDQDVEVPGIDDSELPEHEKMTPIEKMNAKYWAVSDGGRFRVMYEQHNPATNRMEWVTMGKQDFDSLLANQILLRETPKGPKPVPLADAWIKAKNRRTANGVVFDPERTHDGWLNLWTGWGVDPTPGDWAMIRDDYIGEVLCDGDSEVHEYLLNWIAYMVQKPWEPAGVAICFHGKQGTGKSTLGEFLCKIAGRHGRHVVSSEHITGRFNSHLQDALVLFGDEAITPTDRQAQSRMKALITEKELAFEAKGKDLTTNLNRLHVMLASNEDWFVSMAADDHDRRYFISEVSTVHQQDRKFFGAVKTLAYERGGLEAMLHDLKVRPLGDWTPQGNVPKTGAYADQKLHSLPSMGELVFNMLNTGELPFPTVDPDGVDTWEWSKIRVFHHDFKVAYEAHCRKLGVRHMYSHGKGLDRTFWKEARKYIPSLDKRQRATVDENEHPNVPLIGSTTTAHCVHIPPLQQCREEFESVVGTPINWED